MDDAAVVAGLVLGGRRLGLEDDHPAAKPTLQGARGGESENASANAGDIVGLRHDCLWPQTVSESLAALPAGGSPG